MGLENRRSGNASEGSNPSLSANSPANAGLSAKRESRRSVSVLADGDGTETGTHARTVRVIAGHIRALIERLKRHHCRHGSPGCTRAAMCDACWREEQW